MEQRIHAPTTINLNTGPSSKLVTVDRSSAQTHTGEDVNTARMDNTPLPSHGNEDDRVMKGVKSGSGLGESLGRLTNSNYHSYKSGAVGNVRVADVNYQNLSSNHSSQTGGFSRKSRHQAMYDMIIHQAIRNKEPKDRNSPSSMTYTPHSQNQA